MDEHQDTMAPNAPEDHAALNVPGGKGNPHPGGLLSRRYPRSAELESQSVHGIATIPNGLLVNLDNAPGTAPGSRPSHISLAGVLRYKWMILAVSFLVAAPLLWANWAFVKPMYRVKAELRIRPIIPIMVYKTFESGEIPYYQSYVNTQVAMVYSPEVLNRVLAAPEVRKTAWFAGASRMPWEAVSSPMERLREGLIVMPRPTTEVVDLSFMAERPADAAVVLNVILDQYIKVVEELADQGNDALYRKLSDECAVLQKEIDGHEGVLSEIKKQVGTAAPDELISHRKLRLDEEEALLGKLRLDIASLQWRQNELEQLAKQMPVLFQPNRNYSNDPEWRRVYVDMKDAQMQLDSARTRFQENSQPVDQAKKRLALAQETLRAREMEVDQAKRVPATGAPVAEVTVPAELEAVSKKLKLMQFEEKLRTDSLAQQQKDLAGTLENAEILAREKEQGKHAKEMYDVVRARLEQKQMERNVPGCTSVLTRADASINAAKDRRPVFSVLVVIVALGLSMGIAALRSKARQPVYARADLPHSLQMAFLGSLPLVSRSGVDDNPELEEGIRVVRTALMARLNQGHERVFLITSAAVGAGKSTVALMLAKSLTVCGKRVLLVDADLRNPALTRRLDLTRNTGLAGVIAGTTADEEIICETPIPNLSFLQAGDLQNRAGLEWSADGCIDAGLKRWRNEYDVVLLDSAPVLPVADASILCQKTDGVIMVIRQHSRHSELAESMERLAAAGGNIIGTVFIESRRHSGYGYGYTHYGDRES